jgi:cysteine desulfurase
MLYFDHNATTPVRPEALEAARQAAVDCFGNPSSLHGAGRSARARLEECRERLAALLGVRAAELYFTSGGTESNRIAIEGVLEAAPPEGPAHAVVSALEHPSVLGPLERLGERAGLRVARVSAGESGRIDARALAAELVPATRLVCLQHGNNETGVLQPVEEAAAAIRERARELDAPPPVLHADAVQSLGKVPLRLPVLGADLVAMSSHKVGGPRGAGALWVRRGAAFAPPARGGPQERKVRPGTEDLPAIAGFTAALEVAAREAERAPAGEGPGALLRRLLASEVESVCVNGGPEHLLPNTVNVSFSGVPADLLAIRLDEEGLAVSTGSACASGSREPSPVLRAMGLSAARVASAIRFSTGWTTRADDVRRAVEITARAVRELRARLAPT